jgi:hypothetical protein
MNKPAHLDLTRLSRPGPLTVLASVAAVLEIRALPVIYPAPLRPVCAVHLIPSDFNTRDWSRRSNLQNGRVEFGTYTDLPEVAAAVLLISFGPEIALAMGHVPAGGPARSLRPPVNSNSNERRIQHSPPATSRHSHHWSL